LMILNLRVQIPPQVFSSFSVDFQSAIRNPQSAIVDPV
jgi:hypothetical protein